MDTKMTAADKVQAKQFFDNFDSNKDGYLTLTEMHQFMTYCGFKMNDQKMKEDHLKMDATAIKGEPIASFQECVELIESIAEQMKSQQILKECMALDGF